MASYTCTMRWAAELDEANRLIPREAARTLRSEDFSGPICWAQFIMLDLTTSPAGIPAGLVVNQRTSPVSMST